mmetsp:Transcript_5084/g.11041  ORF Transcript_5084/g.11041 Transcript_5084/m.11041 type:complete len:1296 (+) Transcript_5084:141-4028(+)|eukprot:CAMPEP_0202899578 /NCGR_PEP_ID=MMETSP1392-20130828/7767_1 /ASSEMBLY_ACC=CAM_ASM_000868 /TAXON_ID=225041 /ORGANISM="Chlamydomonas chlamydogama, Strain SAG 11-48b" /LENGTH=1295 /DNA_ID=CAMNT_0049585791 /DNA_START=63 /DNA_END=3950 /DNA_ORIENTATION=+
MEHARTYAGPSASPSVSQAAPAAHGGAAAKKTVLSDRFLIGEELGRGAYGQVYKGMDLQTGDTVAIKQISLTGTSPDNLQSVMGEIDLLKTLNHKNIVKYIGYFKTRTHLYIILEFMENGSLASIIKPNKFGVLPESVVAVYIAPVLQGLQYLHEQGVVHRDIKGANILTAKEGVVKLADFGVAAKLGELEERRDILQQHVVGTPYWMAPEVIEMTQVTAASDIWSVGCLIVELLTGQPPYFDLQPMSALFRIVQDDHPPLPDGITPLLEDFLLLCLQKDPKNRPDAATLLQHEWFQYNRRTLRSSWTRSRGYRTRAGGKTSDAHESVNSVVARMLASEEEEGGASTSRVGAAGVGAGTISTPVAGLVGGLGPIEGSNTPSPNLPGLPASALQPGGAFSQGVSPLRDGALAASTLAAAELAQKQQVQGSAALPPYPMVPAVSAPAHGAGQSPGPAYTEEARTPMQQQQMGQQDQDSPLGAFIARLQGDVNGAATPTQQYRLHGMNSTPRHAGPGSALSAWLDEGSYERPSAAEGRRQQRGDSYGQFNLLFAGPDLVPSMNGQSLSYSPSDNGQQGIGPDDVMLHESMSGISHELKRKVRELVTAFRPNTLDGAPKVSSSGPLSGMPSPASSSTYQACVQLEALLGRHPEAKQHFLVEGGALVLLEMLDSDSRDNSKCVEATIDLICSITREDLRLLESFCLVGMVPAVCRFTQPGWPLGLRARAASFIQQLCFTRDSTLHMFIACQGLKHLVGLVGDVPTPGTSAPSAASQSITPAAFEPGSLTHTGLLCIWRVLEAYSSLPLNYICRMLAQSGLLPRLFLVLKQAISLQAKLKANGVTGTPARAASATATKHARSPSVPSLPTDVRAAAPSLNVSHTLDHRALKQAEQLRLADQPDSSSRTTKAGPGPATGSHGAEAAGPSADQGATPPLSPLEWVLEKVVNLLLVMSHADTVVKSFMCTRDSLQSHLDCLDRLHAPYLVKLMKCLRWLTSEHAVLPAIKDAGVISSLVPFLSKERCAAVGTEVQLEALHALHNICKFNKKVHLEAAASAGIIPHLCRLAAEGMAASQQQQLQQQQQSSSSQPPAGTPEWSSFRGFVVPMLIGMVSCSSSTRAKMWASNGLTIFLSLLSEPDTQVQVGVLQALDTWLAEDHIRVQQRLCEKDSVGALVDLYARTYQARDTQAMPQMLETLRQMINKSSKLAVAVSLDSSRPPGGGGVVPWLLAMIDGAAPILRVKLLEIIRCLYEHYPYPKEFITVHRIQDVLRRQLEVHGRGADAVHQACHQLLNAFQINVLL